jgi:hypothetical protein
MFETYAHAHYEKVFLDSLCGIKHGVPIRLSYGARLTKRSDKFLSPRKIFHERKSKEIENNSIDVCVMKQNRSKVLFS